MIGIMDFPWLSQCLVHEWKNIRVILEYGDHVAEQLGRTDTYDSVRECRFCGMIEVFAPIENKYLPIETVIELYKLKAIRKKDEDQKWVC